MEDRAEYLNGLLWTYDANSWLPHGTQKDGYDAEQPVYITSAENNPNNATVVMLTDGGSFDEIKTFERCLNIFDGNDEDAVIQARKLWKSAVEARAEAYYWQQSADGRWEMKASKVPEEEGK